MKPPILLFYPFRCAACVPFRTYFVTIEQLLTHARGPPVSRNIADSFQWISVASRRLGDEQRE